MVSLSAFPKSGVTYLNFLLYRCFFPDDCDIHDLEHKYILDIHAFPEAVHARPDLPRLFKSHFPFRPELSSVRATVKAIYLIRHPIDVMMSAWDFRHLIEGTDRDAATSEFRSFVRSWLETGGGAFPEYGSWVDHVRSWLEQTDVPVHLVTYRDLVVHRWAVARRIVRAAPPGKRRSGRRCGARKISAPSVRARAGSRSAVRCG